jgi:hypothetical protein
MRAPAENPVVVALYVVGMLCILVVLVLGVRAVLTRRLSLPWIRLGDQSGPQQPMRFGGFFVYLGTAVLSQQASLLIPMPRLLQLTLLTASLVLLALGVRWLLVRRD